MNQPSVASRTGLILVCLGLFGAAFAITGLLSPLPPPAAGGTCGPGQGSEAAIVALFDPITIGAGPEPVATDAAGRAQWSAFVHECQTAADDRALAAFPILVVSAGVAIIGPLVVWKRARRRDDSTPHSAVDERSSPLLEAPSAERSPSAVLGPTSEVSDVGHVGSETRYPGLTLRSAAHREHVSQLSGDHAHPSSGWPSLTVLKSWRCSGV